MTTENDEPIPLPPPPSKKRSPSDNQDIVENSQSDNTDPPPELTEVIRAVERQVVSLLPKIRQFDGETSDSKEYRYIEEMFDRCLINMDKLQCGNFTKLREQRKAMVRYIEQASKILRERVAINSELNELSKKMTT